MNKTRLILPALLFFVLILSVIGCGDATGGGGGGPHSVVINPTSMPEDHITTVETTTGIIYSTSLALDTQGRPVICYYKDSIFKICFASWRGFDWLIASAEFSSPSGLSMAYSKTTDEAYIAYYNGGQLCAGTYDYVSFNGASVDLYTNVSAGDYAGVSIALDSDDHSHISYYGTPEGSLKYAEYDGAVWTITTVDASANVGKYSSIALSAQGSPEISYYDISNDGLKFAKWTGSAWEIATVETGSNVGKWTSIALDPSGNPWISYLYQNQLRCASLDGTSWVKQNVDSPVTGQYSSIKFDGNGNPWISYYGTDKLMYASWEGSGWDTQTVDSGTGVGMYTSLAMDTTTNEPRISYFDATNHSLKYYWK